MNQPTEEYLKNLTDRTIKLKGYAVNFDLPKEKQKKAIRLWVESLQKLKKEIGKFKLRRLKDERNF